MPDNQNGHPFAKVDFGALRVLGLSPADKCVYVVIVDHMRGKGNSWPSIQRISHLLEMSETSVRRSIRKLVAGDLLIVERRGYKHNNRYWLPSKAPSRLDANGPSRLEVAPSRLDANDRPPAPIEPDEYKQTKEEERIALTSGSKNGEGASGARGRSGRWM